MNSEEVAKALVDALGFAGHRNANGKVRRALRRLGYARTCTRCGGTGQYSYCPQYGTTCFKCEGTTSYVLPYTPALLNAVKRDVESGLYQQLRTEQRDLDLDRKPGANRTKKGS